MNLYWCPGSQRAAIWAASARALSASRNSSTKRMSPPLLDHRSGQCGQLVVIGLADALQEGKGGRRLLLVDLGEGEAHMDEHPVPRLDLPILQEADVDGPPHPAHVDLGQILAVGVELDDLSRNP